MKYNYDIAIVGAGPAGIFACLEIVKTKPKLKIALFDMGPSLKKRQPHQVMSGFGGAGTYSDGKLHYTAKLSHERVFHLINPQEYQKILEEIGISLKDFGLKAEYYPKNEKGVKKLVSEAKKENIELVIRRTQHAGTDQLRKIIKKIEDYLQEKKINLITETKIVDLLMQNGRARGVIDEKGVICRAKKIMLCPGRIGARWLQKLATRYGIKYEYDMVEVGVRVECPAKVMRRHAEILYEIVLKIKTKTFGDTVRTFCSCPKGFVAKEDYGNYVCVNGHSDSNHNSKNSNFAFVCEIRLTEPVENSIAYGQSIAELASTIGGGKPVLQRLKDLKMGRRSTWKRIKQSPLKPSLTQVTPGDISMALPHRIITNIMEGLEQLDKIMPGINSDTTLLYAPEVKFRSSRVKTKSTMETTLKEVYVAGDATGLSGTITGAAATGIMAARGMIGKKTR